MDPTDANEDLTAEMLSATEVLIYQNATKRLGALRAKIRAFGIKSVARDSGVSRSQLQAIVNGGKTPHKATVAKLDAALGQLLTLSALGPNVLGAVALRNQGTSK